MKKWTAEGEELMAKCGNSMPFLLTPDELMRYAEAEQEEKRAEEEEASLIDLLRARKPVDYKEPELSPEGDTACRMAGREPATVDFNASEYNRSPVEFVFSMNLQRRDLTPSQRAAIAAELAEMFRRGNVRDQGGKFTIGLGFALEEQNLAGRQSLANENMDSPEAQPYPHILFSP